MRKYILTESQLQMLKEIASEDIEAESKNVDLNPTDPQKEAGNYKMGHIFVKGFQITIENPKGSIRKYKDENGNEGQNKMKNAYGYFNRTVGKDGDAVDVFLGPEIDGFSRVYVVDQNNKDGEFDESKVMLGFISKGEAIDAYMSNYSPDWKGFRSITGVSMKVFKKWLYRDRKQRKPFSDYVAIQKKRLEESRKPIRESMEEFDGYRRVRRQDGKANLINTETGEPLSKEWVDWIGFFTYGYAIVQMDGKYNLVDENGDFALPFWAEDIWEPTDGTFTIIDGDNKYKLQGKKY